METQENAVGIQDIVVKISHHQIVTIFIVSKIKNLEEKIQSVKNNQHICGDEY